MLKRKIIESFDNWAVIGHKKALFVKGARQVGKTTSIREFSKEKFKHFIEINFIKRPLAKKAFDGDLDTQTIVTNLSMIGFGPFVKGETVVFFDEIQECPNARTAVKFLVEDGSYAIIESGSLLGINYRGKDFPDDSSIGEIASVPVGYEEHLEMYPLDFEEFLWACEINEDIINILRESYNNVRPVADFIHSRITELYRKYMVVGGLPEVVDTFVKNDDFSRTVSTQNNLIKGYRQDISKYSGKDKDIVKRIFDEIPSQLAKQDKRYVIADIEKGASRRKFADPTQWLIDAGMAYYATNVNTLMLPFSNFENRKLYKLYMLDTGLVCNMSLNGRQFDIMSGDIDINEGALTENFVATELAKKGVSLHYHDKKSKHELDFVVATPKGIRVIEVKSGKDFKRHASLTYYLENENGSICEAIVLCNSNVEFENGVKYLPLYMTMFLGVL